MTLLTDRLRTALAGPLHHRARGRPGRHGHGLPGPGSPAPPPGRAQGASPELAAEPRVRAVPPRNPDRRPAAASAHRAALRLGPGRRAALLRDALHRGRIAAAAASTATPQLTLEDAVRIARGVASALDYAHRQKIVHRDIKPENVMLHEGEPMVTDFGIAKAVTAAVAGSLTQTGMAVGTPSYMSPGAGLRRDRARRPQRHLFARRHALRDARRDRAVHRPHRAGDHRQALHRAGRRRCASSAVTCRSGSTSAVFKALAKAPAARYATAAQFAQALTWPSGTSTPTELKTGAATDPPSRSPCSRS